MTVSKEEKSRRGFDPLRYVFTDQVPPEGRVTEVAEGVFGRNCR